MPSISMLAVLRSVNDSELETLKGCSIGCTRVVVQVEAVRDGCAALRGGSEVVACRGRKGKREKGTEESRSGGKNYGRKSKRSGR